MTAVCSRLCHSFSLFLFLLLLLSLSLSRFPNKSAHTLFRGISHLHCIVTHFFFVHGLLQFFALCFDSSPFIFIRSSKNAFYKFYTHIQNNCSKAEHMGSHTYGPHQPNCLSFYSIRFFFIMESAKNLQ